MGSERSEYRALVAKVDVFTEAVANRRADDLRCSAGCSACCHAWLTVSAVEADELRAALAALPVAERAAIRARGERELAREAADDDEPRCALLDDDGRCGSYAARPLSTPCVWTTFTPMHMNPVSSSSSTTAIWLTEPDCGD